MSRARGKVLHVKVTAKHIARGRKQSSVGCPIALAVRDRHPKLANIAVTHHRIRIADSLYLLPRNATEFAVLFDCGVAVEPIEFDARGGLLWE